MGQGELQRGLWPVHAGALSVDHHLAHALLCWGWAPCVVGGQRSDVPVYPPWNEVCKPLPTRTLQVLLSGLWTLSLHVISPECEPGCLITFVMLAVWGWLWQEV